MKFSLPISLKNTEFLQATPSIRSTWTFKASSIALGSELFIVLLMLIFGWGKLPPQVPLWYSRPWGTERLVPPLYLLIPLAASVLIYVSNIYIAKRFASEHLMFSRVLFLTSALVSVISTIIIVRIITLVT